MTNGGYLLIKWFTTLNRRKKKFIKKKTPAFAGAISR